MSIGLTYREILIAKYKSQAKRLLKKYLRTPKNCILCESWCLHKAPLCKACRKFLYQEHLKSEFDILNIKNYPCYFLWKWTKTNDPWIQKLIVAMKDGHNFALYELFMPWLIKKIEVHQHIKWVAAIPSLDRAHPEALIKAYKSHFTEPKIIELIKSSKKSQKYKTKSERQNTSFEICERSKLNLSDKKGKTIILDDVVSTGGSFKGVLRALEGHNIQALAVWAYRLKL
jgi:predicted amidophosphoribosyltransferase